MSALAPTLQAFFTERLATQRNASGRTVTAYRDTFRLLLAFMVERTSIEPSKLDLGDLDAPAIGAFLVHLEADRHNGARTRNARLAAIHSFFRYAALRHPEHADSIGRVLAIPNMRFDRALVSFLTRAETKALLEAPDRSIWIGRRDHALLSVAVQTGLRVSELTGLTCGDVHLGSGPHVRCVGKGRRERSTPFTAESVTILRAWLAERGCDPADPLFPSRRGTPLSTDSVQMLVSKYATIATKRCPSIAAKNVTPHVLRHSCAMFLREAGVDLATIALWLGHANLASVMQYMHADLAIKERALARTTPPSVPPGRYRAPDALLAFLDGL
jgi:site-specific recombinase XerD